MDINYKKSGYVFNQHQYWTKQPLESIDYFILENTNEGDTILDPFCGTGMTGVSGIRLNRNVILSDISVICRHISKSYCTNFNVSPKKLNEFLKSLDIELSFLYKTSCPICGSKNAEILFSILEEVYLNSFGQSTGIGKEIFLSIKNNSPLPPKNKDKYEFKGFDLIQLAYKCNCSAQKLYKDPDELDFNLHHIKNYHQDNIPLDFFFGKEPIRNYKKNIRQVRDLYSDRNLTVLSLLKKRISEVTDEKLKTILCFSFTSVLFNCSLMSRYRSYENTSIKMGTFYIPQVIKDNNVLKSFISKVQNINKGNNKLYDNRKLGEISVLGESAVNLHSVAKNSIDYIYTDPPYGDILSYSELNLVWESWLGSTTDNSLEMIISKEVGKSEDYYFDMFEKFLSEASRVLKKGKKMTLIFHHPKIEYWKRIQNAFITSNFEPVKTLFPVRLVSENKTSSQHSTSKNTQTFLAFTFVNQKKPCFKVPKTLNEIEIQKIKNKILELDNKSSDYKYDFLINELFSLVEINKTHEELINSYSS